MLWDILVGVLGAILLVVLFAVVLTTLTDFYQKLFEKHFRDRISRPDLILAFSRFSAVATVALVLGVALLVRFGSLL